MNPRQLILLSPYRLPTDSTLYMADEEVAAILSGHAALWHPAALALADSLPRLAMPYEHEDPSGEAVYAVPENPSLHLPDDWADRARAAGAVVFTATADRAKTFANLRDALPSDTSPPVALDVEQARPFAGIGLGHLLLEALCEAMSHENIVPVDELREDVARAVAARAEGDEGRTREALQAAADRLLAARKILYDATLHLLDLHLVDPARLADWPRGDMLPYNVLACAELVQRLGKEHPERFAELRERVSADLAEVVGGPFREREDPLLPLESQLWNLRHGQAVYQELLGREVRVFGRRRSGFHAQLPLLLQSYGISHALLLSFDEAALPSHHNVVMSWPSHDGKQVDSFARTPHPADSAQTGFHLAHHLHQSIMQDQAATLMFVHTGKPAADWYGDLIALSKFAPVLGQFTTLSNYFSEVVSGDYTSAMSPDEFQIDYLSDRAGSLTGDGIPAVPLSSRPIAEFASQVRNRRLLDSAWTYATVLRSLGGLVPEEDGKPYLEQLSLVEDRFEQGDKDTTDALSATAQRAANALAQRLLARGPEDSPGYLVLNPCSFTRRVVVEVDGISGHLVPGGPIKAVQQDGERARLVVEVPPVGFAWVPRRGGSTPAPASKMKLADERCVRNEYLEAEIDPATGGLKSLRDLRHRIGRLGGQLAFNPGSTMRATSVETTCAGPALGEIVTKGVLLDEAGAEIARFEQRFRAWFGRPMLEMRIELEPLRPLDGYPWHTYFGARFAWRDEQAAIIRGTTALRALTTQNRPESPDYVEVRVGKPNTILFPGGLPFHQRHGGRMLDVLLLCQGETGRVFDLGIGLDREQPGQTALGLTSPVAVVSAERGPPHVGAAGWLYQLDAPNVLMTSLRPAPDHPDALLATLVETSGAGTQARFHCVRNPVRAVVQDMRGNAHYDATIEGDAVTLDISASDLLQLRVEFS